MSRSFTLIALILAWPAFAQQQPSNVSAAFQLLTAAPTTKPSDFKTIFLYGAAPQNGASYDLAVNLLTSTVAKVRGAYMGVGVEAPSDTLRSQLKLPDGVGLVLNYIDDNGPAKGLLFQHDVLEKLDDQLLVNGEQLVTLVRLHHPGGSVRLTLIRQASPTTVDVKLGEKEVPPLQAYGEAYQRLEDSDALAGRKLTVRLLATELAAATTQPAQDRATLIRRLTLDLTGVPPTPQEVTDFVNDTSSEAVNKLVNRLLSSAPAQTAWSRWGPVRLETAITVTTAPATQPVQAWLLDQYVRQQLSPSDTLVARASRSGPVTIDDGQSLMWLQPNGDGSAELTVVDRATGAVTFKGPIGTDEQWQKVPEDVRKKFDAWKAAIERTGEKK